MATDNVEYVDQEADVNDAPATQETPEVSEPTAEETPAQES